MENSHVKQVVARRDACRECYGSREEGTPLGLGVFQDWLLGTQSMLVLLRTTWEYMTSDR